MGVVEEELDKLRDGFQDLDRKVANFGRTTATIGERLKVLLLPTPPPLHPQSPKVAACLESNMSVWEPTQA